MSKEGPFLSSTKLKLLTQFKKLDLKRARGLSVEEARRYEQLRDTLNEAINPNNKFTNRRKAFRVNAQHEIKISSRGDFEKAYMTNISGGGIYIETRTPLPLGSEISLRLTRPDRNKSIDVTSEVVWINPPGIGRSTAGMGVQFKNLNLDQERFIQNMVHKFLETELAKPPKKPK